MNSMINQGLICLATLLLATNAFAEFPVLNFNTVIVEESFSTNPNESLVRVSGYVKKRSASNGPLFPAAGIRVRFWQPAQPNRFYHAQTDGNGRYELGLEEGLWQGEACGSNEAFSPARWEALVGDDKLLSLNGLEQGKIELNAALPAYINRAGSSVTLQGKGFGCNGKLVFQYSNHVAIAGDNGPITYHHAPMALSEFSSRSDTQLAFAMPQLGESDELLARHVAKVYYQQGNVRSNAIVLAQHLFDVIPQNLSQNSELEDSGLEYTGEPYEPPGPDAGSGDLGVEEQYQEALPGGGLSYEGEAELGLEADSTSTTQKGGVIPQTQTPGLIKGGLR